MTMSIEEKQNKFEEKCKEDEDIFVI